MTRSWPRLTMCSRRWYAKFSEQRIGCDSLASNELLWKQIPFNNDQTMSASHSAKTHLLARLPKFILALERLNEMKSHGFRRWTLAFLMGVLILRGWFHFFASPLPDEAYYWLWGQNLDWGYFDHPPLQAWAQALSSWLFGTSKAALRAPTVASSLVVAFVVLRLSRKLLPESEARWPLLLAVFISPLYFIFLSMAFNDHLMIAALSLAGLWAFEEAMSLRNPQAKPYAPRVLGIGLMIGLAGLAKFNAALFGLGLVVFLLADRPSRVLFRSWSVYGAFVLAFLCLLPVLYWNSHNGAPTFEYNFDNRFVPAKGFTEWFNRALGLIVLFFLLSGPFLWGRRALGLFLWRRNAQSANEVLGRLVLSTFSVSTIGCLLVATQVHVLAYWNLPAAILAIPYQVCNIRKIWVFWAHVIYGSLVAILLVVNYALFPVSAVNGRPEPESAIMHGWQGVADWVVVADEKHQPDFIATTDYRSGSILSFWLNRSDISVIATRLSQFTLWLDPAGKQGKTVLLMASDWFPVTDFHRSQFESLEVIDSFSVTSFGFPVTDYTLHLGKGFHPPLKQR